MNTSIEVQSNFELDVLELGPMENFIYLITDPVSKRAAVVDPAWDVKTIIQLAKKKGVLISDILLTHSHHDHINGIDELLNEYDAQLHMLKAESDFWDSELSAPHLHYGGDSIQLGTTEIKILHTPGHTPGSACYQISNHLITGDTMFVYGCGRCDLQGGDPEVMFDTLNKMALELPDSITICPGHNYGDSTSITMAQQKHGNPFMHCQNKQEFIKYRMLTHDKVRAAPYHPVLKN